MTVPTTDPDPAIGRADLHLHTNLGDGWISPARLVQTALDRQLSVIAVTHHDHLEGGEAVRRGSSPSRPHRSGWSPVWRSRRAAGTSSACSSPELVAVMAQDAFAGGSFPAALTAMTVAYPLAAWVWGAILWDERPCRW